MEMAYSCHNEKRRQETGERIGGSSSSLSPSQEVYYVGWGKRVGGEAAMMMEVLAEQVSNRRLFPLILSTQRTGRSNESSALI